MTLMNSCVQKLFVLQIYRQEQKNQEIFLDYFPAKSDKQGTHKY